jgi:hypothetical protein
MDKANLAWAEFKFFGSEDSLDMVIRDIQQMAMLISSRDAQLGSAQSQLHLHVDFHPTK